MITRAQVGHADVAGTALVVCFELSLPFDYRWWLLKLHTHTHTHTHTLLHTLLYKVTYSNLCYRFVITVRFDQSQDEGMSLSRVQWPLFNLLGSWGCKPLSYILTSRAQNTRLHTHQSYSDDTIIIIISPPSVPCALPTPHAAADLCNYPRAADGNIWLKSSSKKSRFVPISPDNRM